MSNIYLFSLGIPVFLMYNIFYIFLVFFLGSDPLSVANSRYSVYPYYVHLPSLIFLNPPFRSALTPVHLSAPPFRPFTSVPLRSDSSPLCPSVRTVHLCVLPFGPFTSLLLRSDRSSQASLPPFMNLFISICGLGSQQTPFISGFSSVDLWVQSVSFQSSLTFNSQVPCLQTSLTFVYKQCQPWASLACRTVSLHHCQLPALSACNTVSL